MQLTKVARYMWKKPKTKLQHHFRDKLKPCWQFFIYFLLPISLFLCLHCLSDRPRQLPSCRIPFSRFPSHFHYCKSLSQRLGVPPSLLHPNPLALTTAHEWREKSGHRSSVTLTHGAATPEHHSARVQNQSNSLSHWSREKEECRALLKIC